jgi:hypothetical protein
MRKIRKINIRKIKITIKIRTIKIRIKIRG